VDEEEVTGFITSSKRVRVHPRLVEINGGNSDAADSLSLGARSLLEAPIPVTTKKVVHATRTAGDGAIAGAKRTMGGGRQKSIFSPQSWKEDFPIAISIIAPPVDKNGFPRMIRACKLSSISIAMKSHGMTNLPNGTGMSSSITAGHLTK